MLSTHKTAAAISCMIWPSFLPLSFFPTPYLLLSSLPPSLVFPPFVSCGPFLFPSFPCSLSLLPLSSLSLWSLPLPFIFLSLLPLLPLPPLHFLILFPPFPCPPSPPLLSLLVLSEHQFTDDSQVLYQFVERPLPEGARLLPARPLSPTAAPPDMRTRAQSSDSLVLGSPVNVREIHLRQSSITEASSPSSSPRSSVASLLEECFDVIAQHGPEALIFSTLMKQ